MSDLRKLAEAREALARVLAPFAGHRLTYDDGITDHMADQPEQGKPAALYLDGDWVADFDTTMLPKEKRDDIGRAIVAVFKHAPVVLAQVDRLHDLVRHQRGPLHDAGLLTDEEYAALAADHGAVARLETIDGLRAEVDRLTTRVAEMEAGNAAAAKRWMWSVATEPTGGAILSFRPPGEQGFALVATALPRGDGMLSVRVNGQARTAAADLPAALATIRAVLGADVPEIPNEDTK